MKLIEQFKGLSVLPSNTEKLKEFILDLAVRGKLTHEWREENPNVENASVLITSIANEKKRLVDQKKIKKAKPLEQINPEEIIFKTPNSWIWERLGNVGETNVGLTYKPSNIVENGTPVLRSSNIQDGKLSLHDLVRVNTNYSQKDIVSKGDLLICARNGSRRLVGKCCIIDNSREVMVFGAFMAVYRSSINPFVKLFLQSPVFRSKLEGVETTTINQITQTNLKSTCCPIPPLEEQKAIVEIVKELLNEVEQLEALTKERIKLKEDFVESALNKLTSSEETSQEWNYLAPHFKTFFTEKKSVKSLRETILQLAVQGKLTKKWREKNPNVEPASVLLERIEQEKQKFIVEKKIKKEKLLSKIEIDKFLLPCNWSFCKLGNFIYYGSTNKKECIEVADEEWVVELEDIEKISSVLIKKVRFEERPFKSTKNVFYKGDVLYGKLRPYLDKVIVADENGLCSTEIMPIKLFCESSPEYLKWCLKSPSFIEYANDSTHGMRMPRLGTDAAKNATIPIPPIEEQKAIVEKVNSLMVLCDELEKQIFDSETQIELLMQSCLKEALEI